MAHNTYVFSAYIEDELQTYVEAINAQQWLNIIDEEMAALYQNKI